MINCSHNDFALIGNISLSNRNLKIGRKVAFYNNVYIWGDGTIEIGDNVSIGMNTVLYAKVGRPSDN